MNKQKQKQKMLVQCFVGSKECDILAFFRIENLNLCLVENKDLGIDKKIVNYETGGVAFIVPKSTSIKKAYSFCLDFINEEKEKLKDDFERNVKLTKNKFVAINEELSDEYFIQNCYSKKETKTDKVKELVKEMKNFNPNVVPPTGMYIKILDLCLEKFMVSRNDARQALGQLTFQQCKEVLTAKTFNLERIIKKYHQMDEEENTCVFCSKDEFVEFTENKTICERHYEIFSEKRITKIAEKIDSPVFAGSDILQTCADILAGKQSEYAIQLNN
jgi:hypothetical protein